MIPDVTEVLLEAIHLHNALMALDASLASSGPPPGESYPSPGSANLEEATNYTALSICCSARYLLYAQYGCNESNRSAGSERIALETEAQQLSIQGMEQIVGDTAPRIARYLERVIASPAVRPSVSPVAGHAMYYAAIECGCFYKEFDKRVMLSGMREIIVAFKAMETEWRVGGKF